MQLGFFFTLFLASVAFGQTLQQKIDYSVIALRNESKKTSVDVVSVERGYLMSKPGLKEYVEVKDEKFNADLPGQSPSIKSALQGFKNIFDSFMQLKQKAQQPISAEKIEKEKNSRQTSIMNGSAIKSILASYRTASPLKIISDNVCSTSGARLEGYYKLEKFSFSQIEQKSTTTDYKAHVTQVEYKKAKATESEEYLQDRSSYPLGRYESAVYQVGDRKVKATNKDNVVLSSDLMDQFVNEKVGTDKATNIAAADLPVLKKELNKVWLFFKRVGGCCNDSTCKQALLSGSSGSASGKGSDSSGLAPYVR